VPTFLFNAQDDPFFDHESGESFPKEHDIGDAPVLFKALKHGGHCGFLDFDGFLERRVPYLPRQIARFFSHVRDTHAETNES